MSNTIKLHDYLSDTGVFDKTIYFTSPIQFPPGEIKIRVSRVQISDRIPNIFDGRPFGQSFNNTLLRVGNNVDGWVTIQLETGLYMYAAMIEAAINAAINSLGWWADDKIPGFELMVNTVIDRFVIKIDSTKLSPLHGTQFWFDLAEATTNSKLYYTLGFKFNFTTLVDGTFTSPILPMMETQGTVCVVCCSLMPPRLVNTIFVPYVADVDFAGKTSSSDNVWPQGNVGNDMIIYTGQRSITQAQFYVLTDEGRPMVFMNGRLNIELLFYW